MSGINPDPQFEPRHRPGAGCGARAIQLWPGAARDVPPGIPAETAETSPADPATRTLPVTRIMNVTGPTITACSPEPARNNDAALVVCPGGAYRRLAIDKEGGETYPRVDSADDLNCRPDFAMVINSGWQDSLAQLATFVEPDIPNG